MPALMIKNKMEMRTSDAKTSTNVNPLWFCTIFLTFFTAYRTLLMIGKGIIDWQQL